MKQLWAVDAPHFCAALLVEGGAVVQAAPVLHWTVGKTLDEVLAYCARKGWEVSMLDDRTHHLTVLAEDAAVCDHCGLCEQRTQAVFSRGNPYASLMFVGEAPGADEDAQGRPFVGKSGQLLDRMIEAMGLAQSDVYICNAIKCRPPDNRRPTQEELRACRGFLQMQIRLVQPRVIVALGKTASLALGEDVSAEQLVGWAGSWRQYMGIPVLSTYHPAYLLRTPEAKKAVGKHLFQVKKKLEEL